MKKIFLVGVICCLQILSFSVNADDGVVQGGQEIGNGGDATVFDFIRSSRDGLASLNSNPLAQNMVSLTQFSNSIVSATIQATNSQLSLNGVEVDAVNYPALNLIVFNRARWNSLTDKTIKTALAIHEHLGLLGIGDLNYAITFQILGYADLPKPPSVNPNKSVDILVVVDDSGSMERPQDAFVQNASNFFIPLEKSLVSYRIGIITTSSSLFTSSPALGGGVILSPVVAPALIDPLDAFNRLVRVGITGNAVEQPFDNIELALSEPNLSQSPTNKDFYRPEANLEILIVSDAEDQSFQKASRIAEFLSGLKSSTGGQVRVHAMVGDPKGLCPYEAYDVPPLKILELTSLMSGQVLTLCSPNMGKELSDLATDIANRAAQRN